MGLYHTTWKITSFLHTISDIVRLLFILFYIFNFFILVRMIKCQSFFSVFPVTSILVQRSKPIDRCRSTTDTSTNVMLRILRIKSLRIPTSTCKLFGLPSIEYIGTSSSIERPCEIARTSTTSTIPGGTTCNSVTSAMGSVSSTSISMCCGKIHTTIRRISSILH